MMTFRMRAVVVKEYGGKAEIVEVPAPTVEPGRILIKVAAAGMNPIDGEGEPLFDGKTVIVV